MKDEDIKQYFSYYRIKENSREENKNNESLILLTM